jgi:hypothetical protein
MVNLRGEFAEILREFGSKAILLSAAGITCACRDSLSLAGRPDCPRCLGTGKILQGRVIYARSTEASAQDTLPKNLAATSVGPLPVGLRQWFLTYNQPINTFDLLVMCGWQGDLPVFDNRTEIFRVNNCDYLKGDQGRVEFIKATTMSDPLNATIKLDHIKQHQDYFLAVKEVL